MNDTIERTETSVQVTAPSRVRRIRNRVGQVLLSAAFLVGLGALPASATDPTTPQDVFTAAPSALELSLLAIAGVVIVPAVGYLAVKKGWPLVKRMF
jgi:hypothetical protein